MCSQLRNKDEGIIQSLCCSPVDKGLLPQQLTILWPPEAGSPGSWLRYWNEPPSRSGPQGRLRCGHEARPTSLIVCVSTPRREDGYEEHGEAGADFAMIGHLHEQRKQLLATMRQSESELGSVVLQLSSLESGGR